MDDKQVVDTELTDDVAQFTERYASFSKIINRMQRQYLTLKDTVAEQSSELQSVNRTLQALNAENRTVTEFLNGILTSLSSGVIAVDPDGNLTHINPAAERILGVSSESAGDAYDEFVHIIDHKEISAIGTLRFGTPFVNAEKRVKTGYGTVLTLSVSTSLLKSKEGEVVGAVELFSDVSKLKRMEEQLSRMKVLASLGELAASIAHEVRNPLVGISGFASLLARDLAENPHMKAMADNIVTGVNSINQTIENLLAFARREEVHKNNVNLPAYLITVLDNCAIEAIAPRIEKRLRHHFDTCAEIMVDLDPQLFKQAVGNLVKNALEAGGEHTLVDVSCRILPLAEAQSAYGDRLELSGLETLAEITIKDNGPGIPTRDLERIFTPFYSTKENGTGLGLAIAWKIVKAHGGDLRAISSPGKGTTFSIVMPIKTSQRGSGLS